MGVGRRVVSEQTRQGPQRNLNTCLTAETSRDKSDQKNPDPTRALDIRKEKKSAQKTGTPRNGEATAKKRARGIRGNQRESGRTPLKARKKKTKKDGYRRDTTHG